MRNPPENPRPPVMYDNGRRGNPLTGCDCVQCFGYCILDREQAERARFNNERKDDDA